MDPVALTHLREHQVLAVIRAASPAAALAAADAVVRGGVSMIEVTFTVPAAPGVMSELAGREGVMVGAGTVLTADQARDALASGARFIVAPNLSRGVAEVALAAGVLYMPGAYTTNEILAAHAAGAQVIKVYPVGVIGGPHYIQTVREPLPDIAMFAAGGTTLDNTVPFLKAGCVGVGLGAAIADPKLAEAGKFDEISKRAKTLVHRLKEARTIGPLQKAG